MILYSDKPARRGSNLLSILGTERLNPWSLYHVLIRMKATFYGVGLAVEDALEGDELDAGADGLYKGDPVEIEDV